LNPKKIILYADGGARGNPGPAGAGAYLEDDEGIPVARIYKYIGETTNNVAEYSALIFGLKEAIRRKIKNLLIRMDSQLVVRQIEGIYKVKEPTLIKLHKKAKALLEEIPTYSIEHIPREKNEAADELANLAIDKHLDSKKSPS
jgi:ribonuclease HI